jgi:hypothetical protein
MGILDDAIREHLDLKRKHGARDAELREIEDEAFGAGDQPDPFAASTEAATVAPPDLGGLGDLDVGGEEPTRLVEPEALRNEPEGDEAALLDEPIVPEDDEAAIPGQVELPGQDEIPGQERLDDPLEGYEPMPEAGEETADAIEAEPPAASESLEDLIAEDEPFPEDSAAPAPETLEEPGPSADRGGALESIELEDEELEAAVPDPPPPPPDAGPEPPGRARGRVDVPTQEHPPPGQTGDLPPPPSDDAGEPIADALPLEESEPPEDPPLETGAPELYDFESDDDPLGSTGGAATDDFDALGPAEEEVPYLDEEEPYAEETPSGSQLPAADTDTAVRPAVEDEEAYEGGEIEAEEAYEESEDDLWFEKGPPKDFDFDD